MTPPAVRFLDTNVLLRYFTRDDEEKAQLAKALLERIEAGEETVETSILVLAEVVFTLQKSYSTPRVQVRDLLTTVLDLRGVHVPGKAILVDALELYALTNISFVDAYNAVYLKSRGVTEIYSWDSDFDKIAGVTRLQPQ